MKSYPGIWDYGKALWGSLLNNQYFSKSKRFSLVAHLVVLIPNGGILGYHYTTILHPISLIFLFTKLCFNEVTTHDGSMGRLYIYQQLVYCLCLMYITYIYRDAPPPSINGKWRLIGIPELQHVQIILVVTGILGGDNDVGPKYIPRKSFLCIDWRTSVTIFSTVAQHPGKKLCFPWLMRGARSKYKVTSDHLPLFLFPGAWTGRERERVRCPPRKRT